jgi:hypothetical protein
MSFVLEPTMEKAPTRPRVAFLAQNAVFVVEPDGSPRKLESAFAEGVRDRTRRIAQGQGWKAQGSGGFLSGSALWGAAAAGADPDELLLATNGLGAGRDPGEILYCLHTGAVAGAFAFDLETGEEHRLYHGNQFSVLELTGERGGDRLACTVHGEDGTSDVALFEADGATPRAVTAGDSLDEAPTFVPRRSALVFQSAGMGRDAMGHAVGPGPFAVQELDLESGALAVLAEDAAFDFLAPRKDAQGVLYSLRRPYEPPGGVSKWRALVDLVLFPFRLLAGIFGFLYFFTLRYSGKRLTSADGPPWKGPELKELVLHGRVVDAERAARRSRFRRDDAPPLVPASWELVRHGANGAFEVLAKHALAFDLATDGSILVSNGSAIDRIASDGARERVCKAPSIERVIALD